MKETKGNKPTLTLRRVRTGKRLYEGWTFSLDARGRSPMFIGEEQVRQFLLLDSKKRTAEAAEKIVNDNSPLVAACRRLSDFPHLLALGWKMCVENSYRPCKVLREFGAGAAAKIANIDAIRQKGAELKSRVTKATADFVKAGKSGKVTKTAIDALAIASREYEDYKRDIQAPAESKYRAEALAALALISRMTDFYEYEAEKRTAAKTANG